MLIVALAVGVAWLVHRGNGSSALPGAAGGARPAASAPPLVPGLNTDACRRFAPLAPDKRLTIFVDPGHGGVDPGAIGATSTGQPVQEKAITLAASLDLLPLLRQAGYTVVMSRTGDTTVAQLGPGDAQSGGLTVQGEHRDTQARIRCANAVHANLLVSIHLNAFSSPSVGGAETIYDSVRSFKAENLRFAREIQRNILASFAAQAWTIPDRGVKDDANLGGAITAQAQAYGHLLELGPAQGGWLTQPSAMPGALTEPLFVTDPNEADVAVTRRGQEAIASGLLHAVEAYFAPPPSSASASPAATTAKRTAR